MNEMKTHFNHSLPIVEWIGGRIVNQTTKAKRELRAQKFTHLCHRYDISITEYFHALPASTVERIIEAADDYGYRKPKHANGSRARYFFALMQRSYNR